MKYLYNPEGVCAKQIEVEIDNSGIIKNVEFFGGCPGNLIGIAKLVVGKNVHEVIKDLRGTTCGMKSTSCPDQLTYALELAMTKI